MARGGTLGTFGGVFTPSILTILGVILFLRLPWIVGQGGLYTALAVIVLAHVISVTTGLSISSIATDRKVKAGGNYFMISRSLGLPIGGALGIALFVGLSLSVSLYLIGFSESFLNFWGIETSKNAIRLCGTLALLAVTTITFISTSLAIKTQYFIMAAIALAIASVFAGGTPVPPAKPHLLPLAEGVPFIVLFGIFFPAVTGFEAGVSMSGDLKDPKRSIPVGTLTAIGVGLAIYVAMAVFFAYGIDARALVGNTNILVEVAFFTPAVLAGIWGATLSSALGSILGAPRILQATSTDRITPKLFARGYGKTNEPRNALLLTFAIAEAGILIGELDLLARLVSMFFITTYGFLNLSCAVENWASPDFRPSFRIPSWVGIVGALACFLVMIELDLLALFGATLVMGVIFLFLKRRELTLEGGDTWEGVWSSLIRSGLRRLAPKALHRRNWRPNVLLFSGGAKERPALSQLGSWLIRHRGILTDFDLVEKKGAIPCVSRTGAALSPGNENDCGIFVRRVECDNLYDGMETLAGLYGFSGIEPNTVLLGMGRGTADPGRFARVLHRFVQLDYNVLLLDMPSGQGFGSCRRIDAWWEGGSRHDALSLTLLKFLLAAEPWQDASARLVLVSSDSGLNNKIHRVADRVLEDQRLPVQAILVNNAVDRLPLNDLVRRESADADLVLLPVGWSSSWSAGEAGSIRGGVLFIHGSSYFEALQAQAPVAAPEARQPEAASTPPSWEEAPANELTAAVADMGRQAEQAFRDVWRASILPFIESDLRLCDGLTDLAVKRFSDWAREGGGEQPGPRFERNWARFQGDWHFQTRRLLEDAAYREMVDFETVMEDALALLRVEVDRISRSAPRRVRLVHAEEDLRISPEDTLALRCLKWRKRLAAVLLRRPATSRIDMAPLVREWFQVDFPRLLLDHLKALAAQNYDFLSSLQRDLHAVRDALRAFGLTEGADRGRYEPATRPEREILNRFEATKNRYAALGTSSLDSFFEENRLVAQSLTERYLGWGRARRRGTSFVKPLRWKHLVEDVPGQWSRNKRCFIHFTVMELHLFVFENRLETILRKLSQTVGLYVETHLVSLLEQMERALLKGRPEGGRFPRPRQLDDRLAPSDWRAFAAELRDDVDAAVKELPEEMEILNEASFHELDGDPFADTEVVVVPLRRLVEEAVEAELLDPLRKALNGWPDAIEQGRGVVRSAVRLAEYLYRKEPSADEEEAPPEEGGLETLLERALGAIGREREKAGSRILDFEANVDRFLEATFGALNPYLLIRSSGSFEERRRLREGKRLLSGVEAGRRTVRAYLRKGLAGLFYRRSGALLLARKMESVRRLPPTRVDRCLALVESVSPSPAVLASLPPYYRQMFLGRQAVNPNFLVRRPREMALADVAVQRHQQGSGGGLLLVGPPCSGKTTLTRMVVGRFFANAPVYHLFPPVAGSVDMGIFSTRLKEALRLDGDERTLFEKLPPGAVLVLHDLELWWERTPQGMAVLDRIGGLIDRYGDRVFFLVNAASQSFRLIRRLKRMEDVFMRMIPCEPFDAQEIQTAILQRHEAAGLEFAVDGREGRILSEWRLARLFGHYFDYAGGAVGTAFQGWIKGIERVEENRLFLVPPEPPSLEVLEDMDGEMQYCLANCALHKRMDSAKFSRVMRLSDGDAGRSLGLLARCGLLRRQPGGDVWEIDSYLEPFLVEKWTEMGLL